MSFSWIRPALMIPAFALAISGCNSSSTPSSPSGVRCQVATMMNQNAIGASGGPGSLSVTAPQECAWTASANVNWISNLAPASGQGNGEVRFQVAANSAPTPRTGQITLNGVSTPVVQSGANCSYTITPGTVSLSDVPATGTIAVTAPPECSWTAASGATWLVVESGASGKGNGSVGYSVGSNTGATRTSTIVIGDQMFSATQTGTCALSLSPASQSFAAGGGANGLIGVMTAPGCTWTVSPDVSWITITAPQSRSGNGNGNVTFSVAANSGAPRNGIITIAGQTFAVSQSSNCTFSLDSNSASFTSAQSTGGPVTVTPSSAACTWTAASNASWITVLTGATGTGTGTVTFGVSANTSGAPRTGTLIIAGVTFTVTQAWP